MGTLTDTDRLRLKDALRIAAKTSEGAQAKVLFSNGDDFREVPLNLAALAEGDAFCTAIERSGAKVDDVIKGLGMAYPH